MPAATPMRMTDTSQPRGAARGAGVHRHRPGALAGPPELIVTVPAPTSGGLVLIPSALPFAGWVLCLRAA